MAPDGTPLSFAAVPGVGVSNKEQRRSPPPPPIPTKPQGQVPCSAYAKQTDYSPPSSGHLGDAAGEARGCPGTRGQAVSRRTSADPPSPSKPGGTKMPLTQASSEEGRWEEKGAKSPLEGEPQACRRVSFSSIYWGRGRGTL